MTYQKYSCNWCAKTLNIFHSALIPLRAKKYAINFEMSNEAALKRDQNEQLAREVGEKEGEEKESVDFGNRMQFTLRQ